MEKPILEIQNVKKRYRMGQIGSGTLSADLQSWWARIRGKEDPNIPLFQDQRLIGTSFMALNGVSFSVNKGEAVAIIGGNGAGKSTLLKIISRITAPTEGRVVLRGHVASMLEVGTGFNGEMTGRENIYMNGAILGMTKAEIDSKIDEIIEFSECGTFIDTPVKRYSSGMYVKLAFAVAAHLDSEIMIMDEVLAVGDAKFQKKCLGKMDDAANREGKTILYVSHNMSTVRQLCTRAIVLNEGRVIFDGDVNKGIELYLGSGLSSKFEKERIDATRPTWLTRDDIRITSMALENRDNVCLEGEPARLKLSWVNNSDVEDLCVALELTTVSGERVGTSIKEKFYSGKADSTVQSMFCFDFDALMPDVYMTNMVFYIKDSNGENVPLDCIAGPMIEKRFKEDNDIMWRTKSWGNVRIADPEFSVLI